MTQVHSRRKCSQAKRTLLVRLILVLSVMLVAPSAAYAGTEGYFYLKENPQKSNESTCSDIFAVVVRGKKQEKGKVAGGIIGSLTYMNVDYLLDDYDHVVQAGRGKKYLKIADLTQEVQASKREIYCRIELAMHMKNDPDFDRLIYKKMLDNVFNKLDKTYQAAATSFKHEDFARASYAFELIAPYKDAYERYLQSSQKVTTRVVTAAAAAPAEIESMPGKQNPAAISGQPSSIAALKQPPPEIATLGSISMAASLELPSNEAPAATRKTGPIVAAVRKAAMDAFKVGPITLAVIAGSTDEADRIGPIAAAANATDVKVLPSKNDGFPPGN